MALTPIDVQQKTFVTTFRGYDLDEVDDFLDDVVTTLKDYEQRLHDAQQRIAALENQADGRGESEAAISRALVAAQRSADMIVAEAKSEADEILAGARVDARALEAERTDEQQRLEAELSSMRQVVAELRERIGALAGPMAEDADTMAGAVDAAQTALADIALATQEAPGSDEIDESDQPEQIEVDDTAEFDPMSAGSADEAEDDSKVPPSNDIELGKIALDLDRQLDPDSSLDDGGLDQTGWEVDLVTPASDQLEEVATERVPRPWEDD